MGTVIQMYGSNTTQDNLANIDVPGNGTIVGVDWSIRGPTPGADYTALAQVSFGSVSTFVTNDARAVISTCALGYDLTTSGAGITHANKYVSLPHLPVAMGERIYLHVTSTAGALTVNVAIHFDFDLDRPRARLR